MDRQHQAIILSLIIGLIFGFVLGWVAAPTTGEAPTITDTEEDVSLDDNDESVEDELLGTADPGKQQLELGADENVIHVKDQEAGKTVFLSRVELTQPGWAAIREVGGGTFGNILGAKRFDAGVYQGTVTLLRNTDAGEIYVVMLYADNGDKVFDHEVDPIIMTLSGSPVMMQFEVY